MSRRRRIHVPGGTYYVRQLGSQEYPLFIEAGDYRLFEQVLQITLDNTSARLHAYCWTPEAIHLALTIRRVSVSRFMQSLNSQYARRIQRRLHRHGHFFQFRYSTTVIDPASYLTTLVQYLHFVPVLTGLVQEPSDYLHSSHRAYVGISHPAWLYTTTVLTVLEKDDAYARLMSQPPSMDSVARFESNSPVSPTELGRREIGSAVRRLSPHASSMALGQITDYVCRLLDVSRKDVFSKSRERTLALARALIAWHADRVPGRGVRAVSLGSVGLLLS